MSDTPRTDAAALEWGPHEGVMNVIIPTDFARTLERELAEGCEIILRQRGEINESRAYAEQMTKALRVAKCQLGFILDRHQDEQDCDQDADGHRTPNRDMNTVVDCNIAIAEIDRALANHQPKEKT